MQCVAVDVREDDWELQRPAMVVATLLCVLALEARGVMQPMAAARSATATGGGLEGDGQQRPCMVAGGLVAWRKKEGQPRKEEEA